MQIFVSYKQSWINKKNLINDLKLISKFLEINNIKNFINYRDIRNYWKKEIDDLKFLLENINKEIKKSDLILVFTKYKSVSEWMLIEIWMAKSLNKKIILLIKKWLNHWLLRLFANEIYEFTNKKQFQNILEKFDIKFLEMVLKK